MEKAAHDPRRWIVLGVVAFVAVAVALAVALSPPSTMTVAGTVTVRGMTGGVSAGSSCSAISGISRTVTIFDDTGRIVASADADSNGVAVETYPPYIGDADSCQYSFLVPDVPDGSRYYRISATNDAGGITRSASDLRAGVDIAVGAG